VDWRTFYWGVVDAHLLFEFAVGLAKGTCFGMSIALVSCYYGLGVKGGAPGVGRAVNASVVSSAIGIFVLDFGITYVAALLRKALA
jgi:phospholipid/cholesterol/gamma-HCH transport system permease protein